MLRRLKLIRPLNDTGYEYSPVTSQNMSRLQHRLHTHRIYLCGFFIFFLGSVVSLAVILVSDQRSNGLDVNLSVPSYIWRLGPTIVLTIAISLWRQVNFTLAIEEPWRQMTERWTSARSSIFLDYVSPILPEVLWRSFRNKHWSVSVGVIVFTLLKIMTLFSTTLFTPQESLMPSQETVLALQNDPPAAQKDGTNFYLQYARGEWLGIQYMSVQEGLDWAAQAAPSGAFKNIASSATHLPVNATVKVNVSMAIPSVNCEAATIKHEQSLIPDIWQVTGTDQISVPNNDSCLGYQCQYAIPSIRRSYYESWPTQGLVNVNLTDRSGLDVRVNLTSKSYTVSTGLIFDPACVDVASYCGQNRTDNLRPFFQQSYASDGQDYNYFALGLYNATRMPASSQNGTESGLAAQYDISWVSSAICSASYSLGEGTLEAIRNSHGEWRMLSLDPISSSSGSHDPAFSQGNLSTQITFASQSTSYYYPNIMRQGISDPHFAWANLLKAASGSDTIDELHQGDKLSVTSADILNGMAPNILASFVSFPAQDNADASFVYSRVALRTSPVAFWVMQGCLISALLLLISLIFRSARSQATTNAAYPNISGNLLLSQSNPMLSGRILASIQSNDALRSANFESDALMISQKSDCSIHHTSASEETKQQSDDLHLHKSTGHRSKHWSLWASQRYYGLVLIIVALITIAGLELTQRSSDKNERSFVIKSDIGKDISLLIPAAVMMSLAMLFSAADFAACALSQYLDLQRRDRMIKDVDSNLLYHIAPVAVFDSLRHARWGATALMLGGLIGSVLTSVTTGLYSAQADNLGSSQVLSTIDHFDLQASNISAFGPELELNQSLAFADGMFLVTKNFAFVEVSNATYPQGVYDEIAYPSINFDTLLENMTAPERTVNSTLQVMLPVFRTSLTCWTVPRDAVIVEVANSSRASNTGLQMNVFTPLTVPSGCPSLGTGVTTSLTSSDLGNLNSSTTYFASARFALEGFEFGGAISGVQDVNGGFAPGSTEVTPEYLIDWPSKHKAPACPTFSAFTLHKPSNDNSAVLVNNILCTEGVDELDAMISFNVSTQELDTTTPPIIHEDTLRVKSPVGLAGNGFNYFTYALNPANLNQIENVQYDGFFSALVYGPDGVPIQELVAPDQTTRLINATTHIYRQFFSQFANKALRIDSNSTLDPALASTVQRRADDPSVFTPSGTRIEAKVIDRSVQRIVQNRTAKWILQALIMAMALCLAVGYRDLIAMGRVVNFNPCHIAGRLALCAGSHLVDDINEMRQNRELDEESVAKKLERVRICLHEVSVAENSLDFQEVSSIQSDGHSQTASSGGLRTIKGKVRKRAVLEKADASEFY